MRNAESPLREFRPPPRRVPPRPHRGLQPVPGRRERRDLWRRHAIERRARAEFEDLPGMNLTLCQAARLFSLTQEASRRLLELLMREGLVDETPEGRYVNRRIREQVTGP